MAMINKISFKNYKAFANGEIKIKPITILLGANSVGKSSIMQLFLMLQQTALTESNYKSALKLHGGFVSMGEGVNLIRKKDRSTVFSLSIDYYNGTIKNELKEEYFVRFCEEIFYLYGIVRKLSKQDEKNDVLSNMEKEIFSNEADFDFRFIRISSDIIEKSFDRETFLILIEYIAQKIEIIEQSDINKYIELVNDFMFYRRPTRYRTQINHLAEFRKRKDEYILTYDFLKGLNKKINSAHFKINYDIKAVDKSIIIEKMSINSTSNEILSIEFDSQSNKLKCLKSDFVNCEKVTQMTLDALNGIFDNTRTIFAFASEHDFEKRKESRSIFASIIKNILQFISNYTSGYFENDNINYVSPLRAHPKRYYFLDKAKVNAYVDTLDGDAIAETLKENSFLRDQVNTWLDKFRLKVEVNQLQDIIHKLVVDQNSLSLDITDVGFGISQVLPVIIQGFLSHKDSLTLIEQPEIHLHPKMQADLADLFIDIVSKVDASKYLLIETHSEYLLKRLRRRISEGAISPKNVAIYLIDPQNEDEGAVITELKIEEKGNFEWPVDFYGGELLRDTTVFLKNQVNVQ